MTKHFIIGVDEVGRGPLLGDVVVCALIFDKAILSIKEDSLSPDLPTADLSLIHISEPTRPY